MVTGAAQKKQPTGSEQRTLATKLRDKLGVPSVRTTEYKRHSLGREGNARRLLLMHVLRVLTEPRTKITRVLKPGIPLVQTVGRNGSGPSASPHRHVMAGLVCLRMMQERGGLCPLATWPCLTLQRPKNEMQSVTGIQLLFPKGAGCTRSVRTSGHALGAALPDLCERGRSAAIDSRPARRFPEKKRENSIQYPGGRLLREVD